MEQEMKTLKKALLKILGLCLVFAGAVATSNEKWAWAVILILAAAVTACYDNNVFNDKTKQ